jgi:DNA polymerase III psi subunit
MIIDEEKLNYIHLLLDEPIYVVKEPAETALAVEAVKEPEPLKTPVSQAPITAQAVTPPKPQPAPPAPEEKPDPLHKTKVMILFFNDRSANLRRNEEALLQKILASVQLKMEEVDLLNLHNIRRMDYMQFMQEKTLNKLISFGISLTELNLQIHLLKYQIEKIEGIDMLLADSLNFLEHDLDAKKQLWKCLREMFGK